MASFWVLLGAPAGLLGLSGFPLGSLRVLLGLSWLQLGCSWGCLGTLLASFGVLLGLSRSHFRCSWGFLRVSWGSRPSPQLFLKNDARASAGALISSFSFGLLLHLGSLWRLLGLLVHPLGAFGALSACFWVLLGAPGGLLGLSWFYVGPLGSLHASFWVLLRVSWG